MDVLKTLDSVFTALSLEISKDDVTKYEESYAKLRGVIQEEIWEEDRINTQVRPYTRGIPLDYEPKRANRFVLYFPEEMNIAPWAVQSVSMPRLEIGLFNRKSWSDMEVTMLDPIGPSTTTIIFDQLMNAKNFSVRLEMLDPSGVPVQVFRISIASLKNYENSIFNQNDDALSTIRLTFNIKNVALEL